VILYSRRVQRFFREMIRGLPVLLSTQAVIVAGVAAVPLLRSPAADAVPARARIPTPSSRTSET
jgi:hypothetical protein